MQDLLTKGIDENGNIRSEQTHEFKDSPLGRLPKEWECDKLISFCQKIQDGTHFSPKTDVNGKYKYITSKNIRMGFIDLSNLEFLNEKAHNLIYKRCSVEFGDVLLTKDGASTGNICINSLNEEFSLLSSVALIRGKKKVLKNEFIFQFFMEENGQKSLIEQMSGNAITRITLTKINNTFIKVPPFDEQEVIIKKLKPQDELINQERIKLSKLQSIKTGLMQDLLSGKVGVKIL
jgi:type I restriction enzyme S subunit